jgi:hypothetical protein
MTGFFLEILKLLRSVNEVTLAISVISKCQYLMQISAVAIASTIYCWVKINGL